MQEAMDSRSNLIDLARFKSDADLVPNGDIKRCDVNVTVIGIHHLHRGVDKEAGFEGGEGVFISRAGPVRHQDVCIKDGLVGREVRLQGEVWR